MPGTIIGGKKKKTTGMKRKPTTYNKFIKQFMAKHKGQGSAPELMKKAGAEWRKMSDAEKKKFA